MKAKEFREKTDYRIDTYKTGYSEYDRFAEAYAEQQIKELKGYTEHKPNCKFLLNSSNTRKFYCTCGLNKLLNKH